MSFTHLDGREYRLGCAPGSWGGWAELPGLGLSRGTDSLLVVLQPSFPCQLPPEARELITRGLAVCASVDAQSLMLHELMPELTT